MPPRLKDMADRATGLTQEQREKLLSTLAAQIAVQHTIVDSKDAPPASRGNASEKIVEWTLKQLELENIDNDDNEKSDEIVRLKRKISTLEYELKVYRSKYGDISGADRLDVDSPVDSKSNERASDTLQANSDPI